jgi:hypothetical protein
MRTSTDSFSPREPASRFVTLLFAASVIYASVFAVRFAGVYYHTDALLKSPNAPLGDDFVNLWTAGRMLLVGAVGKIYLPRAFMDFQHGFINGDIGLRLWAYPPHSLLFAWAAGLGGYFTIFWIWSTLGLTVLAAGARRFGFGWRETAILVLSPASLQCISGGQTGNLACGLMLFALSGNSTGWGGPAAAALLTIKPQTSFLLPLTWMMQRRWRPMAAALAVTAVLVGLSLILFGVEPWRDYLGRTLPDLSDMERTGGGPFVFMIPSLFMALRILGFGSGTALLCHFILAAVVVSLLAARLRRLKDRWFQASLTLIATCLATPYLHVYDLGILLAGALPILKTVRNDEEPNYLFAIAAVSMAWFLPRAVEPLGLMQLPLSPLLIGFIFVTACIAYGLRAAEGIEAPVTDWRAAVSPAPRSASD